MVFQKGKAPTHDHLKMAMMKQHVRYSFKLVLNYAYRFILMKHLYSGKLNHKTRFSLYNFYCHIYVFLDNYKGDRDLHRFQIFF